MRYYSVYTNCPQITDGAPWCPITIYDNGQGVPVRKKHFSHLYQGDKVLLGNSNVTHTKADVTAYPNRIGRGQTIMTMMGPALGVYLGSTDVCGLDFRQLPLGLQVAPFRKDTDNVCCIVEFHGARLFYSSRFNRKGIYDVPWYLVAGRVENGKTSLSFTGPYYDRYSAYKGQYPATPTLYESDIRKIDKIIDRAMNGPCGYAMQELWLTTPSDGIPDFSPSPGLNFEFPGIGDLATKAISGMSFWTGNGIALQHDLRHITDALSSTADDLASLSKSAGKALSSLYLSVHYGYKLLASDIRELEEELKRYMKMNPYTSVTAQDHNDIGGWSVTRTLQIFYEVFGNLSSNVAKLSRLLDLAPSTHIAWDSIPYSFVVDWVLNIGDLCEYIDTYFSATQEHNVLGSGISYRATREFTYRTKDCTYEVEQTYYDRSYSLSMPFPTVTLTVGPPSIGHAGEVTALVVQKTNA